MVMRAVTEVDLRAEEFKDPRLKLEDLEFRDDGKIVRKDRWEQACRSTVALLNLNLRNFELGDVLNRLDALTTQTRAMVEAVKSNNDAATQKLALNIEKLMEWDE